MKNLRYASYLGILVLMFLAACGPDTPTPAPTPTPTPAGLQSSSSLPVPNNNVSGPPPALAVKCVPPVPNIGGVTGYCANQVKGLGGATYGDYTSYVGEDDTVAKWNSWLAGDSIPGDVSCKFDDTNGEATCTGPQNAVVQVMVCSSCKSPSAPPPSSPQPNGWGCAQGFTNVNGSCVPNDPKQLDNLCPVGSHYDNALQNCADNVTNQIASPCPPDLQGSYTPNDHRCWEKPYQEVVNCQTYPVQLGACVSPKVVPFNVVPFCQNQSAGKGGANIAYPAGSALTVDVKGNRLDGCAPGGTQADGTQLFTCTGPAGSTFGVQLCTNPTACATYQATLGLCPAKKERTPVCVHC